MSLSRTAICCIQRDFSEMVLNQHRQCRRGHHADVYAGPRRGAQRPRAATWRWTRRAVTQMEMDPIIPHYVNTYMDVFVLRRELLIDLVDRAVSHGQHHFTRELLAQMIADGSLPHHGFPCEQTACLDASIRCRATSTAQHGSAEPMSSRAGCFGPTRPYGQSCAMRCPPATCGAPKVSNTLVADGCIIEGTVENSILFRGVMSSAAPSSATASSCRTARSSRGAEMENCILDKQTHMTRKRPADRAAAYPVVVAKDLTDLTSLTGCRHRRTSA